MSDKSYLRRVLWADCGKRCYYCGVELELYGNWQIDHMRPSSRGGDDTSRNLVAACGPCNRSKGDLTVEEFREAIIRRTLRHTDASAALLARYNQSQTNLEKALRFLRAAEKLLVGTEPAFYGEVADIPRKHDIIYSSVADMMALRMCEGFEDIASPFSFEEAGEAIYL